MTKHYLFFCHEMRTRTLIKTLRHAVREKNLKNIEKDLTFHTMYNIPVQLL